MSIVCWLSTTDDRVSPVRPAKGFHRAGARGLAKGLVEGTLSLVCRPTSGAIDMVERNVEGIVLFPEFLFDSLKYKDPHEEMQKALKPGTPEWWAANAKGGAGAPAAGAVANPMAGSANFT